MQKKSPLSSYAKYSSIGLQMAATVTILAFSGKYLDSFKWVSFPLFTIIGIFAGLIAVMYYIIKKL